MMQNNQLERLFATLPRYEASERFTESVMTAIEKTAPHARTPFRLRLFTAAATIFLAIGAGYLIQEHRKHERVEAIEMQRLELEAELAQLREQADFDPVVDIGEEDGVQYILDLRPIDVQPIRTAALEPRFD